MPGGKWKHSKNRRHQENLATRMDKLGMVEAGKKKMGVQASTEKDCSKKKGKSCEGGVTLVDRLGQGNGVKPDGGG